MADCSKKQVVVLVEGNAAFGPYWPTILNKYLNDFIRDFSQRKGSFTFSSEEQEEKVAPAAAADCPPSVEFALVVFNACGSSSSPWFIQLSRWTNDVGCVSKWLAAIDFSSFSSSDAPVSSGAATAQGLSHALSMFGSSNASQNQRHCILVAASHPDDSPHSDMERVAKLFQQSNVSLCSVYPLQELQNLGAISDAGKDHNPSVVAAAPDTSDETIIENINHLGLSDGNSNYVKVWEGILWTEISGKNYIVTDLHAYVHSSVSKLAQDWPSSMHIAFVHRTSRMESLRKKYAEMLYPVLFHAKWPHRLLRALQIKNVHYGFIKLPSQMLLFTATKDPSHFSGIIINKAPKPQQKQILLNKCKGRHGSRFRRRSTDHGQVSSPGP